MDKDSFDAALPEILPHFNQTLEFLKYTIDEWRPCGSYLMNGQTLAYEPIMYPKQKLLYAAAKGKRRCVEVGVHAGHSMLIMLIANPELIIDCFDICVWEHTEKCVTYLNEKFGNRIRLFKGDSLTTLPSGTAEVTYDLAHIDGDHRIEVIRREVEILTPRLEAGATLVFDDIDTTGLFDFVRTLPCKSVEIPNCPWKNCVVTGFGGVKNQ